MGTETVSWPPEFADFKKLDAALKCGICYEYLTNTMMTCCSHNFCSLCIRKFLQYRNQCPTCFSTVIDVQLRNNRPLDEVILVYAKLRDKLLRTLRIASVPLPREDLTPKTEKIEKSEPKNESSKKTSRVELFKDKQSKSEDDIVVNGVKIPGIFNAPKVFPKPRKPGEFTQCPVCQVNVPSKNINLHLDSCLAIDNGAIPEKPKPKREPLPKRLYHMMSEKNIKDMLKQYNLSVQGDRKTLLSRMQRFTVIYNAENDSPNPRSVPELVQQVEREERDEKRPSTTSTMKNFTTRIVGKNDPPETIEKLNKVYLQNNKNNFAKLIEAMRARDGKNIKPLKPASRVYSDDENDPNNIFESFDPDQPSTSKNDPIYSLPTQHAYDSDLDVIIELHEPTRSIDWSKTKTDDEINSDQESNEKSTDKDSAVMMNSSEIDEDSNHSLPPTPKTPRLTRSKSKQIENNSPIFVDSDVYELPFVESSGDKNPLSISSDDLKDDLEIINSPEVNEDSRDSIDSIFDTKSPGVTKTPKLKKQKNSETPEVTSKRKRPTSKSPACSVNLEDVYERSFERDHNSEPETSVQTESASEPDCKTPRRSSRVRKATQSEKKPTETLIKKRRKEMSPSY